MRACKHRCDFCGTLRCSHGALSPCFNRSGAGAPGSARPRAQKGADLETEVRIGFADAVNGVAVPLGLKASMPIKNTLRTITSKNVLAKLEGADPKLKDQFVVYTC